MTKKNQFLKNKEPQKENIIFLDIDGVLQPYNANDRFNHDMKETIDYLVDKYDDNIYKSMDIHDVCAAYYDWDDVAVGIIKKLVNEHNCKIVMHSGWIVYNNLEQLKALFRLYDLDKSIVDRTDPTLDKIKAINKYLDEHKEISENYIVIDDHDMTLAFGKHFIRTCDTINLKDYTQATIALNEKYEYIVSDKEIVCKKSNREIIKFEYNVVKVKENNVLYLDLNKMEDYYYEPEFNVLLNYILGYFKKKDDISCCTIINVNRFIDEEKKRLWTDKYSTISNNINMYTKTLFIDTIKNGMKGYNFINQNMEYIIDVLD